MAVQTALKEYGLNDKEIEVYVNLLKSGESSLQEISKRCNCPRTTVYNNLNYLISKGLVSKTDKDHIACYTATDPEKMIDILDRKKILLEQTLPELESLKNTLDKKSRIEVYEGPAGIFAMYMEIFKEKEMKYWFGNYENLKPAMEHLMPLAREIRLKKKISAKIIIENNDDAIFHTPKYKSITEMRQTPNLKNFPAMIFIYSNLKKAAIFVNKKEMIGFIVENEQVAQAMKLIFDLYWNQAKPFKL
ncbi:MAG: helix-turn-helix domain-containing protein [Nanoarchaeota archaeon]|nr:helix-turn-helix domain-containing protein [Nanoarchaeota archaeon]